MLTLFPKNPPHELKTHYFSSRNQKPPPPDVLLYAALFPGAPANQREQPASHCCYDAHQAVNQIHYATCYNREQPVVADLVV
jgi:hypothetical protein